MEEIKQGRIEAAKFSMKNKRKKLQEEKQQRLKEAKAQFNKS